MARSSRSQPTWTIEGMREAEARHASWAARLPEDDPAMLRTGLLPVAGRSLTPPSLPTTRLSLPGRILRPWLGEGATTAPLSTPRQPAHARPDASAALALVAAARAEGERAAAWDVRAKSAERSRLTSLAAAAEAALARHAGSVGRALSAPRSSAGRRELERSAERFVREEEERSARKRQRAAAAAEVQAAVEHEAVEAARRAREEEVAQVAAQAMEAREAIARDLAAATSTARTLSLAASGSHAAAARLAVEAAEEERLREELLSARMDSRRLRAELAEREGAMRTYQQTVNREVTVLEERLEGFHAERTREVLRHARALRQLQ
ncbi:hypothetical protein T492DRAFT_903604, partial [Pavlovales sp. CCMP2436]